MTLAFVALIAGLALLVWSADKFVDGAAATARYAGMPPLLIGMVIIGFGTSAPEMVVSALASMQGNPGLALGNAYGSNITNIALILGLTALISPIAVSSQVVRKEIPILLGITLLTGALLIDGHLGRSDALILGGVFIGLLGWSIWTGIKGKGDALDADVNVEIDSEAMPLKKAIFWLIVGLVLLVGASRLLVWGAVTIAQAFGISDLVIGLTIVAVGTSLASIAFTSLASARAHSKFIPLRWDLVRNMAPWLVLGTLTGSFIASRISPVFLKAFFTLFIFFNDYFFIKTILSTVGFIRHYHNISTFGQRLLATLKLEHRGEDNAVCFSTIQQLA